MDLKKLLNMDLTLFTVNLVFLLVVEATQLWDEWWAYEGISGPSFWGAHNDAWSLCSKGKFQSPVDIDPETLIFDPNLKPMQYDSTKVNGELINTGHDITLQLFHSSSKHIFRFSGGPLSYSYQVHSIKLHFGTFDDLGSEHTVSQRHFPLELQIIGYNTDLYHNFTEALLSTHGLAVLAVLGSLDDSANSEFDVIVEAAKAIYAKGLSREIRGFSIAQIIPPSDYYITYEGSITQPSCQETVTWLVINKPIHITKNQIEALRRLNRWNQSEEGRGTPLMENNFRPTKPINRRPVRTNISPYKDNEECAVKLKRSYKVNERLIGV